MMPTPNVTLGAQVDWHHKSDRETQIVSTGQGPGGETIVTNRDLARSSSDLLPLMGYLQLNMGQLAISPYIGVAGGYEVLFLSAEDFATGEDFSGTFDGFRLAGVWRRFDLLVGSGAAQRRSVHQPRRVGP
jgi:hypothetical protein